MMRAYRRARAKIPKIKKGNPEFSEKEIPGNVLYRNIRATEAVIMIGFFGFLMWLGFSAAVATAANTRGHSAASWFFLSVLISPLLAVCFLLALPKGDPPSVITRPPPIITRPPPPKIIRPKPPGSGLGPALFALAVAVALLVAGFTVTIALTMSRVQSSG